MRAQGCVTAAGKSSSAHMNSALTVRWLSKIWPMGASLCELQHTPLVQQNPVGLIDARKFVILIVEAKLWCAMIIDILCDPSKKSQLNNHTHVVAWAAINCVSGLFPSIIGTTFWNKWGFIATTLELVAASILDQFWPNVQHVKALYARISNMFFDFEFIHRWLKYRLYSITQDE